MMPTGSLPEKCLFLEPAGLVEIPLNLLTIVLAQGLFLVGDWYPVPPVLGIIP